VLKRQQRYQNSFATVELTVRRVKIQMRLMKLHTTGLPRLIVVAIVISAIFAFNPTEEMASAQGVQSGLRIVIVEGNEAVNSFGKEDAPPRQITVRVDGDANKPVIGATVFFQMPADLGAGGTINGQRTAAVFTDSEGLAKTTIQPNKSAGTFKIDVVASFQGVTATSLVTQINEHSDVNAGSLGKLRSVLGGRASAVIAAVVGNEPTTGPGSPADTSGLSVSSVSGGEDLPAFAQITTLKSALNGVNPVTFGIPMGCKLTAGAAAMNFTATSSATWLTVAPATGIIPANGEATISIVSVNATDVPDGPSNGVITIAAPGYRDNTQMQISLNCGAIGSRGEPECTIRTMVLNPK
jgi:hypothetical protein